MITTKLPPGGHKMTEISFFYDYDNKYGYRYARAS